MATTLINKEIDVKTVGNSTGYKFKMEVIMNSYDSASNYWNVTINHYAYGYNNKHYLGYTSPNSLIRTTIDGTTATHKTTSVPRIDLNNYQRIGTWTGNIYANSDGNKSVTFICKYAPNASADYMPKTNTISETINMPTIPRYATITSFNVDKRDETSLNITWGANANCDAVMYSLNNGAWVYGSGNNFNITGLSPYTTYNVRLKVKRQDSQLWTPDANIPSVNQTTYNYPYVSSVTNNPLIIGNSQTVSIYNPLNRTFTLYMKQTDVNGELLYSEENITGVNKQFTPNSQTLYNSIPSGIESNAVYYCVYNNQIVTTVSGKYSLDINENKPIFEDFNYSTDLSELTGNHNTIINGITNVTFTIPVSKKAIARNGATILRYVFECGSKNELVTYSDNQIQQVLTECSSNILKVTAVDSRGLETTVSKEVPNFMTYYKPSFMEFSADRENGVEETSYVNAKIHFFNYNFGSKTNTIRRLNYRIKDSSTDWSNWYDINPSELVIVDEEATLTDCLIYSDGISQGFTIGKQYILQLRVSDGVDNVLLGTTTSDEFLLSSGIVAFSILKDENGEYHIGINGMPSLDHTLEIHGDYHIDTNNQIE